MRNFILCNRAQKCVGRVPLTGDAVASMWRPSVRRFVRTMISHDQLGLVIPLKITRAFPCHRHRSRMAYWFVRNVAMLFLL
jgi:hypothetical protein